MSKKSRLSWFANDDLSITILSLLPSKILHHLKLVSKDWLNLICDRTFITAQLKKTEPVSGFFYQEVFQFTTTENKQSISYIPADVQNSKIWPDVLGFLPEYVVVLSLDNGLLCCRNCFPTSRPKIYVCNPLRKQWATVEWPKNYDVSRDSIISLSFDPFRDPIDKSTNFQLVAVSEIGKGDEDGNISEYWILFDIYSSETGSWRRSNECCVSKHGLVRNKKVILRGVSFWLTEGYGVLMFDIKNELSWLVSGPLPLDEFAGVPEMCLGESGGKLHYVVVCGNGLQLWALEDHFEPTWELRVNVPLDILEKKNPDSLYKLSDNMACGLAPAWMTPLAFKDGKLLVRVSVKMYLYEFETGRMKKLCNVSTLGPTAIFSPIVVPYAMSLVPLE
ncbi:Unknown protein [Striga hermonthica]|uniref:F-box protein At3g26010-like beta-propeller domain-containing protein n=1 Tax=Striga hermonthica TaxID=68872 RepID=A0A9N7MYM9_STRHE|nr:Unknown protein [Striga hermonthica]